MAEIVQWAPYATAMGLSAKLAYNVLGPTSHVLGRKLEQSVDDFHLERLSAIFRNAESKLHGDQPGAVPPRVLGRIVEEAQWVDDVVVGEYLGGILASGKTPDGRDDRALSWTAKVRDLSAYSLRMHYVIYRVGHELLAGRNGSVSDGTALSGNAHPFIPHTVLLSAMDFLPSEDPEAIIGHCFFRLQAEDLLRREGAAHADEPEFLRKHGAAPHADTGGLVAPMTPQGVELFLWGLGCGTRDLDAFLDPDLPVPQVDEIDIQPGSRLVCDMRPPQSEA